MKNHTHIISCFCLFICIFGGCRLNNANKTSTSTSHVNDSIELSLYGVKLGDSIDKIFQKFPKARAVPLDSLEDFLPIRQSLSSIYDFIGISIYSVDTSFIVNHTLRKEPYHCNGSPAEFNMDYSDHWSKLAFFILDGRVSQIQLFINTYLTGNDSFFPNYEWGQTCLEMFKKKYGECDSLICYNNTRGKSITLNINATDDEIQEAIDNCRIDDKDKIGVGYVWQWKNAQIIFEDSYNDFGIKPQYSNFHDICRILISDIEVYNRKYEQIKKEEHDEEVRKRNEFNLEQKKISDRLKKQDF